MNFVLQPSLEQRALVKMAVSLWNQNDIRALIALLNVKNLSHSYPFNEKWKEMEASVLEKVQQLPLPQPLNDKVSCFVHIIGLQIFQWIRFHCLRFDLPLSLPLELCWTPQGMVDRKRTAEVLVRDERLDISTRYMLACLYCLEDSIHTLWDSMPDHLKKSYCNGYPLIGFWSRTMERRGLCDAPICYKSQFVLCASGDNKVAVEYFLQKLTPREREETLVETAKRVIYSDTLCFLITQMDEEQQMEVFKGDPSRVLRCFLQWPWQSFFMEVANRMWDYLPKMDYEGILSDMIDKVRESYKDWNYPKLFREFWQKSPHVLKSLVTDEMDESSLLPDLCRIKDKEIIRLILQNTTHTAREKLIYSDKMNDFCQDCIRNDEWDSLQILIRECFPSKDLMSRFKEEYEKCIKWKIEELILVRKKHKWDKLFLSLDDSLREYDKRSADEGECSSSKRFRSLQ